MATSFLASTLRTYCLDWGWAPNPQSYSCVWQWHPGRPPAVVEFRGWPSLTTACCRSRRAVDLCAPAGPIPPELGSATSLTRLSLDTNTLHGTIPDTFSKLSQLRYLSMSYNDALEGPLPASLSKLTALTYLSTTSCSGINGTVPSGFSNLRNLVELWLDSNWLTGRCGGWTGGRWVGMWSCVGDGSLRRAIRMLAAGDVQGTGRRWPEVPCR